MFLYLSVIHSVHRVHPWGGGLDLGGGGIQGAHRGGGCYPGRCREGGFHEGGAVKDGCC